MANIKYSIAIRDAIAEEMRRDPRVFLMGEDVARFGGVFGCTLGIPEEFGSDRIRSTPISEAAFVGAGLGMAITGARPIVELQYVDFIMCAMDQLVNQTAKVHYMSNGQIKVPYTLRVQQGCGRGNGAQHAQNFESLFANIPGLKVVCPATPADAKGLLKTAIRDDNPVMFCEHKMLYATRGEVTEDPDFTIPFGKAAILREANDVTIIATAYMVARALEAAHAILVRAGIGASHMPEEFALQQIFIECRAMHSNKRFALSRAHLVNGPCKQFFPGAAFACDQDSRSRLGNLSRLRQQIHHLRRIANDPLDTPLMFVQSRAQFLIFLSYANCFQAALDHHFEVIEIDRLGQVIIGTDFHRFDRRFNGAIGSQHDDQRSLRPGADFAGEFHAVQTGHAQVRKNNRDILLLENTHPF